VILFVHGFLGSVDDWAPLIAKVGGRAVPIPQAPSIEEAADALVPELPCTVVGYSLGGRMAMLAASRNPGAFTQVITLSAHPGCADDSRLQLDRSRADRLEQLGLADFVDEWYRADLWEPLREHPGFAAMLQRRRVGSQANAVHALRTFSPGLQPDLWGNLPPRLTAIVGGRDPKYLAIGRRLERKGVPLHVLPKAGHALLIEAAEPLAEIIKTTQAGETSWSSGSPAPCSSI